MGTKMISIEPYYLYEPKQEFSTRIDEHFSSFHKQRKVLRKRNGSSAFRRFKKRVTPQDRFLNKKDSILIAENVSSEALLPFIDIAMKLQQDAYEAALATNRGYELQLLLIFLEAFISIVFNCYYMISVIVEPAAFKLPMHETIGYLSQHLIQPILCILCVVLAFSLLKHQFRKSQEIINKLVIHSKDNEMRSRFLAFSQQTQANIPNFSIFGFFELDGSVIFAMISATTTYLIILVQALGGESEVDPIFSNFENELNKNTTN